MGDGEEAGPPSPDLGWVPWGLRPGEGEREAWSAGGSMMTHMLSSDPGELCLETFRGRRDG